MTLCLNFIFFFIIMEKNQKISYSLKEKFLLVWPEQRIRRMIFFTRSIVLNIWMSILVFALWSAWFAFPELWEPNKFFLAFLLLMMNAVLFYFQSTLITKRLHDFNNSWKKYVTWYKILLIFSIVIWLIGIFWMPAISENPLLNYIDNNIDFILYAMYLYPLFRPWTKWDNQYGPDDSNVKTWFLG